MQWISAGAGGILNSSQGAGIAGSATKNNYSGRGVRIQLPTKELPKGLRPDVECATIQDDAGTWEGQFLIFTFEAGVSASEIAAALSSSSLKKILNLVSILDVVEYNEPGKTPMNFVESHVQPNLRLQLGALGYLGEISLGYGDISFRLSNGLVVTKVNGALRVGVQVGERYLNENPNKNPLTDQKVYPGNTD